MNSNQLPVRPGQLPVALGHKESLLIDQLLFIENAQERMGVLMDRARLSGGLEDSERIEENRVSGCVSKVWMAIAITEGKCRIRFDAESPMVKALVGLICRLYDGADPAEVPQFNPVLLEKLQLDRQLSPTRLNGLHAVIARINSQVTALIVEQEKGLSNPLAPGRASGT